MKIVESSYEILTPFTDSEIALIERAARTCYKSEDRISDKSSAKMVRNLIERGHEAMLEHSSLTVKFVCDRGVSHELVRHRMASFAQESTRYCNYTKDKFDNEITVIKPFYISEDSMAYIAWKEACEMAESAYNELVHNGYTPQEARCVLPTCLKTEVVVTANFREWRHILKLRTAIDAHPQIRELMLPLLIELRKKLPSVFCDIGCEKWEATSK